MINGPLTDRRRVAVTWAVCIAAFAAFNVVFWPAQRYQQWHAPENFLARAEAQRADGASEEALTTLREGIARFRPPASYPYGLLASWSEEGAKETSLATATEHFYLYREGAAASEVFAEALDGLTVHLPAKIFGTDTRASLGAIAEALFSGSGIAPPEIAWTAPRHVAFLEAAQGAVSVQGNIGRTGVAAPVDFMVLSGGGTGARRAAVILVNGQDYATSRRGLHAAIVDPNTGAVTQSGLFDFWEHPEEADRMLRFLDDAPSGAIGLFAVFDDASVHMSRGLEEALLDFGLYRQAYDKRRPVLVGLRHSFAAIGVKGAGRGTALQAWSPEGFAGATGHPVVAAALAAQETAP